MTEFILWQQDIKQAIKSEQQPGCVDLRETVSMTNRALCAQK